MKPMFKGLDTQTQLLVGVGAAVASGCIPCLEKMSAMAKEAGIATQKLKTAAIVGQFVKEQPASHVKAAADRLLGTHLQASASKNSCGCPMRAGEEAPAPAGGASQEDCR